MTYLVNDKCIKCKHTTCVDVCPVDCFYEGKNMLVIKPDECIDCGVCEPECPIDAIVSDTEAGSEKWTRTATMWQPMLHSSRRAGRRQARPRRRWEQDFVDFFANRGDEDVDWRSIPQNPEEWEDLVDEFSGQMQQRH